MKSMTGYGKSTVSLDERELTVELKSVNHRFLDISVKMPRTFLAYEDSVRSILSQKISRGHIDVFVNYKKTAGKSETVTADLSLATQYVNAANKLLETFPQLRDGFSITDLMRCTDVLSVEQAEDSDEVLKNLLNEAVGAAADNLNAMRETEGNKLRSDILDKISKVEELLGKVRLLAPQVQTDYRDKLRRRVLEALQDVALDEGKLANEVCFFADKCCIDEEITRLDSHISHARQILSSNETVGRKMDFLVQEFNRETNTICSKSNCVELTNVGLEMKNEIEKIREQIQNLE